MEVSKITHPKVFISYSHDCYSHELRILKFSEQLRADGIDTRLDQYSPWPAEGWPRWMERQIREADFVLLVCTETYCRRVTGMEEPGSGRGVCWEANLIYNELYTKKVNAEKYVPILFEDADQMFVPPVLQGFTVDCVATKAGYENLYRRLTNQPLASPRPIGELKKLTPLQELVNLSPSWISRSLPIANSFEGGKIFFISYPHSDPEEENLARYLYNGLTKMECDVFIDIGIKTGSDWVKEIAERLNKCDCLIVLLSERSMSSEMLQTEVRIAYQLQQQYRKPWIIPVRLRYFGLLEYELDLYLSRFQFIKWNNPDESEKVLREVLQSAQIGFTAHKTQVIDWGRGLQLHYSASSSVDLRRPLATADPRSVIAPGGTIRRDDPYYIARPADQVIEALASNIGVTLTIKGSRQVGKSSLLLNFISKCQRQKKGVAFVDFSIFSNDDYADYPTFLSRLAFVLQCQLDQATEKRPAIDSQFAMIQFLENSILTVVSGPLVIAFDEVDRMLGRNYQADFFTMLRCWHNSRTPLTPKWQMLDLAMSISTEPYLLINEADRSPFNVGRIITLEGFTRDHCCELNQRYHNILSKEEVNILWDLLHGHPYLTRLAFYLLTAPDKLSFQELIDTAADEHGPFNDHLRALLTRLHKAPALMKALQQIIRNGVLPDQELYYCLYGAGLVRRENNRINPANILYARYFKKFI